MTTTKLFEGFSEEGRNSSRVTQPPGGGSSNIFGGAGDSGDEPRKVKNYYASDIFGVGSAAPSQQQQSSGRAPRPTGAAASPFATDSNAHLSTGPQQPARAQPAASNPVSHVAEKKEEQKPTPAPSTEAASCVIGTDPAPAAKLHTSTRVRQPPGGASSGPLW